MPLRSLSCSIGADPRNHELPSGDLRESRREHVTQNAPLSSWLDMGDGKKDGAVLPRRPSAGRTLGNLPAVFGHFGSPCRASDYKLPCDMVVCLHLTNCFHWQTEKGEGRRKKE